MGSRRSTSDAAAGRDIEATSLQTPAAALLMERARALEDPALREYGNRETVRDWAGYFASAKFSKEKEDLLVRLLVDRTLSLNIKDRAAVDRLIAQVLTPDELLGFAAYRDDVPNKHSVAEAIDRIQKGLRDRLSDDARQSIEAIVRNSPLNHDTIWKDASDAVFGRRLSLADLEVIEKAANDRFEQQIAHRGANLSATERERLRRWFKEQVLDFNLRALTRGLRAG